MQHFVCHVAERDSSDICYKVQIAFILALFYLLKPLTYEEERKPEYPEITPDYELTDIIGSVLVLKGL